MNAPKKTARPRYLLLILLLAATQWASAAIRRSERAAPAPRPDLSAIPLTFACPEQSRRAGWQGKEQPLDQESLDMLQPEAYLVRDYTDADKQLANLIIIYGHSKSNLHSPALCFLGGGWNVLEKARFSQRLGEAPGRVEMNRLYLQKGETRALVLYTFLSPGASDSSWPKFQARLLWARLRGKKPAGALVRFAFLQQNTRRDTEKTADRFLQQIYPAVLRALRF